MVSESISLERRIFRLSELLPVAIRLKLASGSLKRTASHQFCIIFHGFEPFLPQNPNFDPPTSNSFAKVVYRFMYSKELSKTHQTWNQISVQHNSPIQPIFTKPSTTTQFIPQIRNYEHPRYESSTTIPHNNNNINQTWFHQQSINNNSFFIIYG